MRLYQPDKAMHRLSIIARLPLTLAKQTSHPYDLMTRQRTQRNNCCLALSPQNVKVRRVARVARREILAYTDNVTGEKKAFASSSLRVPIPHQFSLPVLHL